MRTLSILIFGAIPAIFVGLMSLYSAVIGMWAIVGAIPAGLLFLLWGASGIVGTVCLWLAAFNEVSGKLAVGLAVGLCGMLPFAFRFPEHYGTFEDYAFLAMLTSPPATALVLLCRYSVGHIKTYLTRFTQAG